MASTTVGQEGRYSAGRLSRTGASAPLDALHAARQRPARAGAGHRLGRRLLRPRRRRQALPRRALGAVTASTSATGARSSPRRRPPSCASSTSSPPGATRIPRAIELAERIAALAPGDLNRVFFTSGGSEAVESALKLARAYHRLTRKRAEDEVHRPRGRLPRDHARRPFRDRHHRDPHAVRAAGAGRLSRAEHQQLSLAGGARSALGGRGDRRADRVRGPRDRRGGDPRAGPERRRLPPAAGWLFPARPRDLRPLRRAADLRRGDLLVGALGHIFGSERYGYLPDIITTAKGITSAYVPMGAMIASDRVAEPFLRRARELRARLHLRRAPAGGGGRAGQHRADRA